MKECCDEYYYKKKKVITTTMGTQTLAKMIKANFEKGDIIGLTFINEGTAAIAQGIFMAVIETVVVVKDLLLEGTMSFIPLSDVNSIEKGIEPDNTITSVELK